MNTIVAFLSGVECRHAVLALLHTLWQGVAVGAILWLCLWRIPAHRPDARYWTAFSALLVLLLAGLVTWSVLDLPENVATPPDVSQNLAHSQNLTQKDTDKNKDAAATLAMGPASTESAVGNRHAATADPLSVAQQTSGRNGLGDELGEKRSTWPALFAVAWLLGVVFMMGRMVWMVARSRRWTHGPEIADHQLWLWTNEIRHLFGIRRPLRIVETLDGFGPAILGVVRPVLALPVSMMTGLPPETLRAILAHELAHLRRHDYLFNLVQMVVEAVLFFNPAVWWINRQIRVEREACCDALAARYLGEPLVLAQALSLWAERAFARRTTTAGVLATAFAEPDRHGSRLLLDRIHRILLPTYRPQMPISPFGLLGWLTGGLVMLGLLSCGTSAVVEIAAKALTPAERMERIVETQKEYASPENDTKDAGGKGQATLSGTLRTYDGKPVPKQKTTDANTREPDGNRNMKCIDISDPSSFTVEVPSGTTWLSIAIDGYALAIAGPFHLKSGEKVSDIDMLFEQGTPHSIHVADSEGKPVAEAVVQCRTNLNGFYLAPVPKQTDAEGNFTLWVPEKAKTAHYDFGLSNPGYQTCSLRDVILSSDEPTTLTLPKAKPVVGTLLSPEGQPVAGVSIRQYIKASPSCGDCSGENGPVLAVTDEQGQFTLDVLEDHATYFLGAESEKYGKLPILIKDPRPDAISAQFGPLLTVSGTVQGSLDKLPNPRGKPSIYYSQRISLKNGEWSCVVTRFSGSVGIETIEGKQCFSIQGLLPGKVSIYAGAHNVQTLVDATTPHQEMTLDLNRIEPPPAKRSVVIRFEIPDQGIQAEGSILVDINSISSTGVESLSKRITVPLENGMVKFDAYAPGSIYFGSKGLLGYWFFEERHQQIEPGETPLEIAVPVVAAGAIVGQVLNADGTPTVEAISLRAEGVYKHGNSSRTGGFGNDDNASKKNGKFFITPLPLDGKYVVLASRGHTTQISSVIELNATKPTANITLQMPQTTSVEGQVLDPDGKPLVNFPLPLSFSLPANTEPHIGGNSWSGGERTDNQGRFRFNDLGVGVGQYALEFKPQRDFRPCRISLPLDGKPITVQLQRGQVLEGKIIDDATGKPVPGVELYAMPPPFRDFVCEAESVTDKQGRFRFSNLDDRAYQISTRGVLRIIGGDKTYQAGGDPIVLHTNSTFDKGFGDPIRINRQLLPPTPQVK